MGWNAYLLSEADHRQVGVEDWGIDHQSLLSDGFGTPLRRTDETDDRLGQVLSHLADDAAWRDIETRLWQQTVSVYRLPPEGVRLDATRLSGDQTPTPDGVMQRGSLTNARHRAHVKRLAARIDGGTSGHRVATQVVSAETADDPLSLPVMGQSRQTFGESGRLYIGGSQMSASELRGELARGGDFYRVPLAKVGEVLKRYDRWVPGIVEGSQTATLLDNADAHTEQPALIAAGDQPTRTQKTTLPHGEESTWEERLWVVRSLPEAKKECAA